MNLVVESAADRHVVFYDTSWDFYEAVLRQYDERPTRVNYADGTLEIMTLSIEHERYSQALGEMVADVAKRLRVPFARGGSATLRSQSQARGLEADQCFWVANESAVRNVDRLDLAIHPPPDLVIEVDITHAVVDRESIYAKLGVPEMWHFDTQTLLTAWELTNGNWTRIDRSKAFPAVRPVEFNPFLQRIRTDGHMAAMVAFGDWVDALR